MSQLPCIVIGGGGHARVLIAGLKRLNRPILGLTVAEKSFAGTQVGGSLVLGTDDILERYDPKTVCLINGIGSTRDMTLRHAIFERFIGQGFSFASVIHPSAFCENDVELGEGIQVMAGAVIQTGCRIGANTIINTSASVDHDCRIGAHCHIAPGVTLSGGVEIGDGSHVGVGSSVIQNIHIGSQALVAAGSTVISAVPSGARVSGVPAREIGS